MKTKNDVQRLIDVYGGHYDNKTLIFNHGHCFQKGLIHFVYKQVNSKRDFMVAAKKLGDAAEANGMQGIDLDALSAILQRCSNDLTKKGSKPECEQITTYLDTVIQMPTYLETEGGMSVDLKVKKLTSQRKWRLVSLGCPVEKTRCTSHQTF